MKLTPDAVSAIFRDCLFQEGEPTEDRIEVDGITMSFGLHPERTRGHEDKITALLAELPDEFQATKGGGMSFLNMCVDRHGNQWTGLHQVMQELVVLGLAVEKVIYPLPKEIWNALPGAVPYIMVKT